MSCGRVARRLLNEHQARLRKTSRRSIDGIYSHSSMSHQNDFIFISARARAPRMRAHHRMSLVHLDMVIKEDHQGRRSMVPFPHDVIILMEALDLPPPIVMVPAHKLMVMVSMSKQRAAGIGPGITLATSGYLFLFTTPPPPPPAHKISPAG